MDEKPNEVYDWITQQKINRVLGKLKLSEQRRIEHAIPSWTWTFWDDEQHPQRVFGEWVYQCGWAVERQQVHAVSFRIGNPWQAHHHWQLQGREVNESEEVVAYVRSRWEPRKLDGWTPAARQSVQTEIDKMVAGWTRYTLGEVAAAFRRHLQQSSETLTRVYNQAGEGQFRGKETLLNKIKSEKDMMEKTHEIVRNMGRSKLIHQIVDASSPADDLLYAATLNRLLEFGRTAHVWHTLTEPQQTPLEGTTADKWVERRRGNGNAV